MIQNYLVFILRGVPQNEAGHYMDSMAFTHIINMDMTKCEVFAQYIVKIHYMFLL